MRHFLCPEEGPRSILFTRHRFLGKNKQERPCSEAKRRDACPRKTVRVEQKKAQSFSLENNCTCLQSQKISPKRNPFHIAINHVQYKNRSNILDDT